MASHQFAIGANLRILIPPPLTPPHLIPITVKQAIPSLRLPLPMLDLY